MSVQGNELVISCGSHKKKYLIYTVQSNGSISFTPFFKSLWGALNPAKGRPSICTLEPLPPVRTVNFKGTLDQLSGYVDFRRTDGVPSDQAVIVNEGTVLNPYFTNESSSLRYEFSWKGSNNVKGVIIYVWFPNTQNLQLGIDSNNGITCYTGSTGCAILPRYVSFFFRVVADSDEFELNLTVSALEPSPTNCQVQDRVCLAFCACGEQQTIPLYRNVQNGPSYTKVIEPQWRDISDLVEKSLREINVMPLPPAPITGESWTVSYPNDGVLGLARMNPIFIPPIVIKKLQNRISLHSLTPL
jgi:hypothetical protein